MRIRAPWVVGTIVVLWLAILVLASHLPAAGANALLHPPRRLPTQGPPAGCIDAAFEGHDVTLRGWRCPATAARRGAIVVLHGVADNREGAAGLVDRFTSRGFDLISYDSRAHGASDGESCTYGYFERLDLRRVLDDVGDGPIVLIGTSLGASVALHAAAQDQRVTAIVAAEAFADLRTIVAERAPFFVTRGMMQDLFTLAERQGRFRTDAISSVLAAARIAAPTLLIHGDADVDTPAAHSRRIYAALRGPKRLLIVSGARHNESLRADTWPRIERWIEDVVSASVSRPVGLSHLPGHASPTPGHPPVSRDRRQ